MRYIAALSFFFILFDQPLLSLVFVGIALYVEKDEWLSRQTLQALFLSLFSSFVSNIFVGYSLISSIESLGDIRMLSGGAILRILIGGALSAAVLVFIIIGIVRTVKEQDAGIPFFSGLTYRMFGLVKPNYMPQQPPMGYYYQQPPMAGYAPQQQPYQPVQPPVQAQPANEQPSPSAAVEAEPAQTKEEDSIS